MTAARRTNPKRNATKPIPQSKPISKNKPLPKTPQPLAYPTPIPTPQSESQPSFLDPAHKGRFDNILTRPVKPTLFYSKKDAEKLGLHGSILWALSSSSWEKFLSFEEYTYKDWTYEFLASLEVHGCLKTYPKLHIKFQLDGEKHKMTVDRLNEVFGWKQNGVIHPDNFDTFLDGLVKEEDLFYADEFWSEITDREDWRASHSKSSSIINPTMRMLHRLIKGAFYPKKDMSQVCTSDLRHLWFIMSDDLEQHGHIDYGSFLIRSFLNVRDESSEIHCGGFITCIAKSLGLSTKGKTPVSKHKSLDIDAMKRFEWIELERRGSDTRYVWCLKGNLKGQRKTRYSYLPRAEAHLTSDDSWLFAPNHADSIQLGSQPPLPQMTGTQAPPHVTNVEPREAGTSSQANTDVSLTVEEALQAILNSFTSFREETSKKFDIIKDHVVKLRKEVKSLRRSVRGDEPATVATTTAREETLPTTGDAAPGLVSDQ